MDGRRLVSGEYFHGDSRLFGLQGIDFTVGGIEGSLLTTTSTCTVARGKQAGGRVGRTREGAGEMMRVRVRVRMMMGMGMAMGMVKALSSPVGAGDGGH